MSEKQKAFDLFDEGCRPSDIYNQIKVTHRVLYKYFQEWKKVQEGMRLEIKEEEKDTELQQEAEQAEERAKKLQQEADEEARRKQKTIRDLRFQLMGAEGSLKHFKEHPDTLVDWFYSQRINKVYPSPEEYLGSIERRCIALRAMIERTQRV